jgi:hypothetical protein
MIDILKSRTDWVLGIDPGSTEGYACFLNRDNQTVYYNLQDKWLDTGLAGLLLAIKYTKVKNRDVYLENVHGVPGEKGANNLTENVGLVKGILISACIEPTMVSPQVWQVSLELGGKMKYDDRKKLHQQKATALSNMDSWKPISMAKADALLIAHYGRRQRYGE